MECYKTLCECVSFWCGFLSPVLFLCIKSSWCCNAEKPQVCRVGTDRKPRSSVMLDECFCVSSNKYQWVVSRAWKPHVDTNPSSSVPDMMIPRFRTKLSLFISSCPPRFLGLSHQAVRNLVGMWDFLWHSIFPNLGQLSKRYLVPYTWNVIKHRTNVWVFDVAFSHLFYSYA